MYNMRQTSYSYEYNTTVAAAAAAAVPQAARPAACCGLALLPLLCNCIHSCSLPYVIYYTIFKLIFCFINHSTFLSYLLSVVGGGS